MASLNKVILIGNITADPELKQSPSGVSVIRFTIAINRRLKDKQETDFINIVAWRKTAEFVKQYFSKGKPISVCGSLHSGSYTDNAGNKKYFTEVVADEVGFVEGKSDGGGVAYVPDAYKSEPHFEPVDSEEDLPF